MILAWHGRRLPRSRAKDVTCGKYFAMWPAGVTVTKVGVKDMFGAITANEEREWQVVARVQGR